MSHKFNRAARRHFREHLIVRRRKESSRWCSNSTADRVWLNAHSRVRARTAALCSCAMCGNPRRYYGNSAVALTLQEIKQKNWRLEIE